MDFAKIRPRGGTKAQWEKANPVLAKREIGVQWETTIGVGEVVIKIGDGVTDWINLPEAVKSDITKKIIAALAVVPDDDPDLADGDYLDTLFGKIAKKFKYLKDNKLDKSARYDGTDSTSTELVPTANALRGVNAKADKNASDITTINNNLSNIRVNFKKRDATTVQLEAYTEGNVDGINIQATKDKKFYMSGKFDGTWNSSVGLATKDDLNTVLMYRGVITGDLNRGRNLVIAPGIYSIQSVSTITNGPSDFGGWGIFVQFPDNLFSQMILNSPNYIKFRKYSGQNPSWGAW